MRFILFVLFSLCILGHARVLRFNGPDIHAALIALADNDTLMVAKGVHKMPSGSGWIETKKNIAIISKDGPGCAIIEGGGRNSAKDILAFNQCKNILVEGIELRNGGSNQIRINGCDSVTIKNCYVHTSFAQGDGIRVTRYNDSTSSSNITIEACIVRTSGDPKDEYHGMFEEPIVFQYTHTAVVRDCWIFNMGKTGNQLSYCKANSKNIAHERCVFGPQSPLAWDPAVGGGVSEIASGWSVEQETIRNCLFINCISGAIGIKGYYIYNNSFINCAGGNNESPPCLGVIHVKDGGGVAKNSADLFIFNNVFYSDQGKDAHIFCTQGVDAGAVEHGNNLYCNKNAPLHAFAGYDPVQERNCVLKDPYTGKQLAFSIPAIDSTWNWKRLDSLKKAIIAMYAPLPSSPVIDKGPVPRKRCVWILRTTLPRDLVQKPTKLISALTRCNETYQDLSVNAFSWAKQGAAMELSPPLKTRSLDCARAIADWLCAIQAPAVGEYFPPVGYFPFLIHPDGTEKPPAQNWNYAFASMALLGAYKTFKDPRYERAALYMGRYMKSLQILDPFHGDNYGAIREVTPYTPWCYTRDTLSVAWAFIELYRHTKDPEYLERARLWGEWFLKKGCDEDGWPYWGHEFEPLFDAVKPWPQMCNDVQGSFQGGSLNFLYQMFKETGDNKWIGEPFTRIAGHFIKYIQYPSGFYGPIVRATKQPAEQDPQGGLHRANDDLGTLGLLCAYKISGNKAYLASIEKYLKAVFDAQWEDGRFEESVACIPVVMNVLFEGRQVLPQTPMKEGAVEKALNALFNAQSDGRFNPRMSGGILEYGAEHKAMPLPGGKSYVCARSSCYALIVLPKLAAGSGDYLKA